MPTPLFIETNFSYANVETDYWTIVPKVLWISKSKISKPVIDEKGHKLDKIVGTTYGLHLTKWITLCFNG
jgi:hypothetical protein